MRTAVVTLGLLSLLVAGGCSGDRYEPQVDASQAYLRFVEAGMGRGDIEGACAVVSSDFNSTMRKQGTSCKNFVKSRQRPDFVGLTLDRAQISEGQQLTRIPRGAVRTKGVGVPFDVVLVEVAKGFGSGWVVDSVEEGR